MNSSMHVIWARGQRADTYYHRPTAGVDNPNLNISDTNYYKRDELKYHGQYSANNNRGFTTINFYGESLSVFFSELNIHILSGHIMPHRRQCDVISYARWVYLKIMFL